MNAERILELALRHLRPPLDVAARYTVEADGAELAEIAELVATGKVKPHVAKTYSLDQASDALSEVEKGHSVGKIVLVTE